jgi:hypothetical protein
MRIKSAEFNARRKTRIRSNGNAKKTARARQLENIPVFGRNMTGWSGPQPPASICSLAENRCKNK